MSTVASPSKVSSKYLPPGRQRKKGLKTVSRPLRNVRLSNLIYVLVGMSAILVAFYTYRFARYKSEVGGWWNLALGKRSPQMATPGGPATRPDNSQFAGQATSSSNQHDLEYHINGIASILNVKPTDLASALSNVLREQAGPKTLSSISSSASAAKEENSAVSALFGDDASSTAREVSKMSIIAKAMDAIVGLDDPMEG